MKTLGIISTLTVSLAAAIFVYARGLWKPHSFTFAEMPVPAQADDAVANHSSEARPAADGWPQWRGPKRDGVSPETGLASDWPDEGPPLLWTAEGLGRGMSGVAVAGGRIFTMGKRDDGVCLIALDADNGRQVWSTPLPQAEGEPNGTPAIHDNHVFAITYDGILVCAEAATGDVVWQKDFVAEFGGSVPQWGYSESPLVDGDVVVCTPGAEQALIVAIDRSSGRAVWTTAAPSDMRDPGHDGAGYSSIVISHGAGVRQYVQLFGRGVIGVSATDGTPLWGYNRMANYVANIPTPIVRDDHVLVSTGYGAGTALLRMERTVGGVKINEVYFHPGHTMQNHHGGMVLVDDHVYFGHGHNKGFPMCVEFLTGKVAWGPERGPGSDSAAVIYADGHLYFRYQNAVMALVEATPTAYRLKASFRLPSHLDNSWPHPVIAGKRLYLRDQDVLLCYDIQAGS